MAALVGSFGGQGAKNTTGYSDPFSSSINVKAAPTAVASLASDGQAAKNTTAYPTYGASPTSSLGTISGTVGAAAQNKAPTSTPAASTPSSSATTNGQSIYDMSTDPIVQKIQQLNSANYGQAVAGAQSSAKQDIINSGFNLSQGMDPATLAAISGSPIGSILTDASTLQAAAQNPFSTAAGLLATHNQNNNTIDQGDNDNNLYYSSTHANNLGQEVNNYLGSVSGAQGALGTALNGLLTGLTSEQQTEQQNLADTIASETENVIQNAISSGQVMLGYDSNGNPIFGNAPGSSTPSTTPTGTLPASAPTPVPAVAPGTPAPLTSSSPFATAITANKTGGSANKKQGIYAIH